MNDYHDRAVDDPQHPETEDRPVAGWPGHEADQHRDEETGEQRDDNRDETAREDEPLVGEVWNQDAGTEGERAEGEAGWQGEHREGEHEAAGETTADDEADRGRFGEFGTEEPVIVEDATDGETAEGEHAATTDLAEGEHADTETEHLADDEDVTDTETEHVADGEDVTDADAEPVAVQEPVDGTDTAETVEPVVVADAAGTTDDVADAEPATGARPTDADEFTVDQLIDDDAAGRFRDRWREVKGTFVDDPADAVRQASALSGEAVEELTAALGRLRENLDGHWGDGSEADTERLRVALRGYGSLIDRVLGN
jgi:hypothetical protein